MRWHPRRAFDGACGSGSAAPVFRLPLFGGWRQLSLWICAVVTLTGLAAGDEKPAARSSGGEACPAPLDSEELDRRRKQLDAWVFEPVALRDNSYVFHVDRADGSFALKDLRGRVHWYSSWGRRGFASVKRVGGASAGAGDWVIVDQIRNLVATDRRIRFEGASSQEDCPLVRFVVEALSGGRVSLRYELPSASASRVAAVRLLDQALWVADEDPETQDLGGDEQRLSGALLPRGGGEWIPAKSSDPVGVELRGFPGASGDGSPFTLSSMVLSQGGSMLHVRWLDPRARVIVERRPVTHDGFPGRVGLFATVELTGAEGTVELLPLGTHEAGLVAAARAHSQLVVKDSPLRSLRHKTGARPELRAFPGAALFRPDLGGPSGDAPAVDIATVCRVAERTRETLEIDQAAFVLSGWEGDLSAAASAPQATKALADCASAIQELGFLFGLEVSVDGVNFGPGAERLQDSALEERLDALEPQIVLLRSRTDPGVSLPHGLIDSLRQSYGLVGIVGGSEIDLASVASFEGFLRIDKARSPGRMPWPFFTAAFGSDVRLAVSPADALGPGDLDAFLEHLLVGEVPVYALGSSAARAAPDGRTGAFSREDGWTAGRGLSPREVFLKNTFEVATHLARWRNRYPLAYHRKLTEDGSVQETFFGQDLRVLVNFGPENYEEDRLVLPPHGFLIRFPFFVAFHALRMNGLNYERPAFFTVRSLEGKMYLRAERVRLYHGFGPNVVRLGGKNFTVTDGESVVKIW